MSEDRILRRHVLNLDDPLRDGLGASASRQTPYLEGVPERLAELATRRAWSSFRRKRCA